MNLRRRAGAIAAVVAVALLVLPLGPTPAASADPPPSLTIAPAGPWLDQQVVVVSGDGLAPETRYELLECDGDACVPSYLYLQGGIRGSHPPAHAERSFVTDANGSFSVRTTLHQSVSIVWSTPTDCAVTACDLVVTTAPVHGDRGPILARTPLSFTGGTYVWPAAHLDVEGQPGHHRSTVAATATGLDPTGWVRTLFWTGDGPAWHVGADPEVCVVGAAPAADRCRTSRDFADPGYRSTLAAVPIADDGQAGATVGIDRFPNVGGTWTDCAVSACSLRLTTARVATQEVTLDVGPVWAPWESAEAMIDGLSELLDAQELSSTDRAALVQAVVDGELDAFAIVSRVARGNQARGDVATLYAALLKRSPDQAGFEFWVEKVRAGTASIGRVADTFTNTPEARAGYAGLSDAAAIEWAYQATLGRGSDPSGKTYWLGRLASGLKRYRMVSMFGLAPESRARTTNARVLATATFGLTGGVPCAEPWADRDICSTTPPITRLWKVIDFAPAFRTAP